MCSELNSKVLKYGSDRLCHHSYSKTILKTLIFEIIGAASYTNYKFSISFKSQMHNVVLKTLLLILRTHCGGRGPL